MNSSEAKTVGEQVSQMNRSRGCNIDAAWLICACDKDINVIDCVLAFRFVSQ